MTKKRSLLIILFMLGLYSSYAHCIWIETEPVGAAGRKHEARIYYGEYVEGLHESMDGNFKDMKDLKVWLLAPGKERVQLQLVEAKDHFEVAFTPDADGVYTLLMENTHIKLYDTKGSLGVLKPAFYATAAVTVGKAAGVAGVAPVSAGAGSTRFYKVGEVVPVAAAFNGKPLSKTTVTVFSPSGWSRELTTDEKGESSFKPEWKGRYVVEVIYFDKTPGADYQTVRNVSTTNLFVQ